MNTSFLYELVAVGVVFTVIGMIVSYIAMGEKSKDFKHWPRVALTFFITGLLGHLIFEYSGMNKWYCKNGYACKNA